MTPGPRSCSYDPMTPSEYDLLLGLRPSVTHFVLAESDEQRVVLVLSTGGPTFVLETKGRDATGAVRWEHEASVFAVTRTKGPAATNGYVDAVPGVEMLALATPVIGECRRYGCKTIVGPSHDGAVVVRHSPPRRDELYCSEVCWDGERRRDLDEDFEDVE